MEFSVSRWDKLAWIKAWQAPNMEKKCEFYHLTTHGPPNPITKLSVVCPRINLARFLNYFWAFYKYKQIYKMSVSALYTKWNGFLGHSFCLFALSNATKWTTTATLSHFLLHMHSQPSVRAPHCFTAPPKWHPWYTRYSRILALVLLRGCPQKNDLRN